VNFQDILSTIANIYTTKKYQKSIPNGLCTLKVFWSHTCHEHTNHLYGTFPSSSPVVSIKK